MEKVSTKLFIRSTNSVLPDSMRDHRLCKAVLLFPRVAAIMLTWSSWRAYLLKAALSPCVLMRCPRWSLKWQQLGPGENGQGGPFSRRIPATHCYRWGAVCFHVACPSVPSPEVGDPLPKVRVVVSLSGRGYTSSLSLGGIRCWLVIWNPEQT